MKSQSKFSDDLVFFSVLLGVILAYFLIIAPLIFYLIVNFAYLLVNWYEWLGKILP